MKDTVKKLNRLWRLMIWVAVATQVSVIILLLIKGEWALSILASVIFPQIYNLHRNRTTTYTILKDWCNAAVKSDLKNLEKSLDLEWKVKEYEWLLDGLQKKAPTSEDAELRKLVDDILGLYCVRRLLDRRYSNSE